MSYANGVFGCFSDFPICIYGAFCPCCLNGKNHARLRSEECTACHVINCTSPYWIRKDLEKKNGESNSDVIDCLFVWFCAPCAICQDARDLK